MKRAIMPRMDIRKIQPSIDALNLEIAQLTAARDTLVALTGTKKRPTLSDSQRAAWAEQKRRQRAAKRKAKK